MDFDSYSHKIIGGAIEVHRLLGPGLLESAYEECLMYELQSKGLAVERQKPIPVIYKEKKLDELKHTVRNFETNDEGLKVDLQIDMLV